MGLRSVRAFSNRHLKIWWYFGDKQPLQDLVDGGRFAETVGH